MDAIVTNLVPASSGLAPFSLKDAPAMIERVFPAQRVGVEAQKERKAVQGQTLTALGSYWKGRKPLVLVRACVLASLLPATADPDGDLEIFEMLMRMDFDGLTRRGPKISAADVWTCRSIAIGEKQHHIEMCADLNVGNEEDGEQSDDPQRSTRRKAEATWKPIDLDRFDKAEKEAAERSRARISQAEVTGQTKEEQRAAVTRAKQEGAAEYERIRNERNEERNRVLAERRELELRSFAAMPFSQQVGISERVEKIESIREHYDPLYDGIWERVNDRLGTRASSIPDLVEELGIARFGHRPVVGDPFAGGGSIPFEAARVGCDVVASDLNPVAAMLTWGALNIIGADPIKREAIAAQQKTVATTIDSEITRLGIEHDSLGNRAKTYLYCIEVVDPQTGWRVPMAPSWVISRSKGCAASLVPDYGRKRFDIVVRENVPAAAMKAAEVGTVRDGHLVYRLAPIRGEVEQEWQIPISRLRGDGEGPDSARRGRGNKLRPWCVVDLVAHEPDWAPNAAPVVPGSAPGAWVGGDVWLERLYAIQWINGEDIVAKRARPRTHFIAPTAADLAREATVLAFVIKNLVGWQAIGLLPDMAIEAGEKTDEPTRTRGWTYWHHLFTPRHLLFGAIARKAILEAPDPAAPMVAFADALNRMSRLTRWDTGMPGKAGGARDGAKDVFYNQALNCNYAFAQRSCYTLLSFIEDKAQSQPLPGNNYPVHSIPCAAGVAPADIWIYDPPYADAVYYHEITEFFIAWLRRSAPPPFDQWNWDSRRPLAIKGKGEKFRSDMIEAFQAMAQHMPGNGVQICMFTHQDAGVWADMAQIVWGAGLRVTAAWYVSTETTSELKKGGYVQGTVLMALRKRQGDERGYRDEVVLEVRGAVKRQVGLLTGLNQRARASQRDENPFSDADIQMAGYAAALEVLTGYTHIEGVDMTREALRPRIKGMVGIVEEMISLAVQTATELMRPDGIQESLWERLVPTERFWLKMMEAEANRPVGQPCGKLDDYQNFAKAYRADGWDDLMADNTPNQARLKGAAEFKRTMMSGHPFSTGLVRPVLYAINELRIAAEKDEDAQTSGDRAINGLRDNLTSWGQQRIQAHLVAEWLGRTLIRHRPEEATAARTLAALIRTEKLG
jgi:adenine-specific DNA methylase